MTKLRRQRSKINILADLGQGIAQVVNFFPPMLRRKQVRFDGVARFHESTPGLEHDDAILTDGGWGEVFRGAL